jgi:uncharacterized protein (TIGR03437 family)
MRTYLALLLLSGSLWAQTSRDQARRADLNFVATQLPKLHVNFFFQLSPADYAKAVAALDAQVPTLTDAEFNVGLAKLVALAGDEHTTLIFNGANAMRAGFQQFPLEFRWLDDGIFVTAAASQYSRALGTRLIGVGNSSIDDVVGQLSTVIPHSNSQWVHFVAQSYLRGQQILQGLDIVPGAPTTRLTFRTLAGDEFSLDVGVSADPMNSSPAPDQGPIPEYLQRANENYWFTYSASRRLLYFKYNQCAETAGNPFAVVAGNLLSAFDANPVDTLVIDFRGNTGGDDSLIQALTDGLIARIPAFLANPNFRVYVVIDKGTFSAAMDDAMLFKSPASDYAPQFPSFDPAKIIRVIGEPTGGSPAHYGQVAGFTLPSSKIAGTYSTQYIPAPTFITPDYDSGGPSFGPDVAIPLRASDFFARHDPVMAAIVARFEGAPPAPSGGAIAVNGASFRAEQGLAPGSLASVFGNFSAVADGVFVNGQSGRVFSAGPSQVNFVVPAAVNPGRATISVRSGSSEIANGQASITAAGPGIFVAQGTDPSQPGAILNQDSSFNTAANRAARNSILQIFATGYGPLDSTGRAAVQVFAGGVPAEIQFSGPIPQFVGLWQINARLPDGVSGQVPVFIVAGDIASNGVTVWVQ